MKDILLLLQGIHISTLLTKKEKKKQKEKERTTATVRFSHEAKEYFG